MYSVLLSCLKPVTYLGFYLTGDCSFQAISLKSGEIAWRQACREVHGMFSLVCFFRLNSALWYILKILIN